MVVLHDLCENDLATSPISATEVADLLYVPATIFTHTDTSWLPSQLYLLCALTLARKTSHHFRNMANFDGVGGTQSREPAVFFFISGGRSILSLSLLPPELKKNTAGSRDQVEPNYSRTACRCLYFAPSTGRSLTQGCAECVLSAAILQNLIYFAYL